MAKSIEEIKEEIARWQEIRTNQMQVLNNLAKGGQHYEEREGDAYTGLTRMKEKEVLEVIKSAEKKIKELETELAILSGAVKKSSRLMWSCGV